MTLVLLYGRIIPTDPAMPLNFGLCTTRRAFLSIILFYTEIPIWAAVEVMSFGTLSKYIKNLSVGSHSIFRYLSKFYSYKTSKGNLACPNQDMLTSWIHAVVVLRNICAHNSRIYNRSLSTKPKLLKTDRQNPQPRFCGLYHFLLAMKYLRPSDTAWNEFAENFRQLLQRYRSAIDPGKLHLPADWQYHI